MAERYGKGIELPRNDGRAGSAHQFLIAVQIVEGVEARAPVVLLREAVEQMRRQK